MDLAQLVFETRMEFPGFMIKTKSSSFFMKVVAFLLLIVTFGSQKKFMTTYVTTIGKTVYVPDDWNTWEDPRKIIIIRHERVHMRQARRLTFPVFALLYILLPLPLGLAWFRARFEWEAYTESIRAARDVYGDFVLSDANYRASIVGQFTTGAYGWMWPFKKTVERWYDAAVLKVLMEKS